MESMTLGIVLIIVIIVLLLLGMPIGFAMALVGFIGIAIIGNVRTALSSLGLYPYGTVASYVLTVIPLFIVMGHFGIHAGLSRGLYDAMFKWLGRLPCGLAIATVGACAAFASITGSSVATAAAIGKIALPEMKRFGYQDRLATGCIAAAGTLGILIPPSVTAVIYATLTDVSVGKMLIAGIIPGILVALVYGIMLMIWGTRVPEVGPRATGISWRDSLISLRGAWQVLLVFGLIMGGIYSGIFTPTEAGAAGAFVTLLLALGHRQMSRKNFLSSLLETGQTTAMIFILLIGVQFFTLFVSLAGIPMRVGEFIIGLPVSPMVTLILILALYIPLGMFFDGISMMLLTIPIFYPVLIKLGFDGVWFGILLTVMIELGLLTPPVGVNVFVIKGIAPDVPLEEIFRGIIPFAILDLVVVAILVAFPQLVLWLPGTMG